MRKRTATLLFGCFLTISSLAQVPLIKNQGWQLKAGADNWFPLTGQYYDISVISGSDYFWDMVVNPKASSGVYAGFSKLRSLYKDNTPGFIGYGVSYKWNTRRFDYDGWEGGGISGKYTHGSGEKRFSEHSIWAEARISHQLSFGIRNRTILNSLSASAGFILYKQEKKSFDGYTMYSSGTTLYNNAGYERNYFNDRAYIPNIRLNYELGYVIKLEKYLLVPFMEMPILNFNSYLEKPNIHRKPLDLKKEYYKEVVFGISLIAAEIYK